ncbi:MAG: hypothetical protein ACRDAM_03230, partial [Casimicrobium sp.]
AGNCESAGKFCARQLDNPMLSLDYGYGNPANAAATTTMQSVYDTPNDMTLQPDGKVLISGYCAPAVAGPYNPCILRYEGGPYNYQNCKPDVDGDGSFLATTDALIWSRIALGMRGASVLGGINFATNASRKTWPAIREYLISQCGLSIAP